ncbi:ABC transporter permease [Synoicihabitans lomoniglobus]|uniref:ABC transporter permease n=1 Tax=Synoicihabitans lomoniglobus TaxID=2909285 RepID=A0AAE9ZXI6_9BACT|nr:ABC transporter permease [Opitutaceae bacterium LMO-M01]WED65351.1 ABC transporter permease [Opitutaceae bacterium LMO-M01]
MQTLRFALRRLAASPGYTLTALLTLALGIGVNTAMFSVVDALLFRSAPFPEADRIVQLTGAVPQGPRQVFSFEEVQEIRAGSTAFAALTTFNRTQFVVAESNHATERLGGVLASAEMFETFGVQPMLGRAFTAAETEPGRNDVVLLSHAFWQQRYGGDAAVLGRTLRLDGRNVTIIGVMPAHFDFNKLWGRTAMWQPINFTAEQQQWRDYRTFTLMGRLHDGATAHAAAHELAAVANTQQSAHPDLYSGLRYQALALPEALSDSLGRQISWMLLSLAGFVLLIACANLANLQLARATSGLRDLAIRTALGASRARLITQQLAESIVLALAGGLLGIVIAQGINRVVESQLLIDGAPGLDIRLNGAVLALTLAVAALTGVAFGIVPALIATRVDPNAALKNQSRGSTASRGTRQLRHALIVGEVALALVLLAGAGLMQRGFAQFLHRDVGWDFNRVLTATLPLSGTLYPTDASRRELFERLEINLRTLPGVDNIAIATSLPVEGYSADRQVLIEGQTPGDSAVLPSAFHAMVTPDFFATIGLPLVEGRLFAPDIKRTDPHVVVINQSLANQLFPHQSAVGQRLGSMDSGIAYWSEIIGVVPDVEAAANLSNPSTRFVVYKALVHEPWGFVYLAVRSQAPASLIEPLRRAILALEPDLPPAAVATVPQTVDANHHNLVLAARTLTAFALLGLALAAVGIYGVIAHLVTLRTAEFGVRLALGASPRNVLRLVLRQGLTLTVIGLMLGLVGAWTLGRFLHGIMPRLSTAAPGTILALAGLLLIVAGVACYLPARRATRVDPLDALRSE